MLFQLLVIGSFWFYAFIGLFLLIELLFVSFENYGWSILGLLAFLGVLQFLSEANPLLTVRDNPGWVVCGVLAYLVIGVVWTVFKWRNYVLNVIADINKNHYNRKSVQVSEHKEDILGWMSLWPFSLILYVFQDLICNIYEAIYTRIAKFLQKMSDDLFAKYVNKE